MILQHYCPWCGAPLAKGLMFPQPLHNELECLHCHKTSKKHYNGKELLGMLVLILTFLTLFGMVKQSWLYLLPAVFFVLVFIYLYSAAPYVKIVNGIEEEFASEQGIACELSFSSPDKLYDLSRKLFSYCKHTAQAEFLFENGDKINSGAILHRTDDKKYRLELLEPLEKTLLSNCSVILYQGNCIIAKGIVTE